MIDADIREALRDLLRDENGLPPTESAIDVIGAAVLATEKVDEHWTHAGTPSVVDYAAAVVKIMEKRYLGRFRR